MTRRESSTRAAALRRAQTAKAGRDTERIRREAQIEAALADYYEATSRAERIRAEARRKSDGLAADAEKAVAEPLRAARNAVRRLRELLGGTSEVAALCGLSVSTVRSMLADREQDHLPAGGHPGEVVTRDER